MNTASTEIVNEEQLQADIARTIAEHQDLVVKDDQGYIAAQEALKFLKKKAKQIEDWFKPQVKKAHELHKELKGKENAALNPLREVYKSISGRCGEYRAEQERIAAEKQREEEERLRKEEEERRLADAEKLEAEGKREEAEEVISEPVNVAPVPWKAPPKVEGVSYTTTWKFEIEDTKKIPREFMQPDTVKIGQYVRAMKESAKIEGVKIWAQKTPRVG